MGGWNFLGVCAPLVGRLLVVRAQRRRVVARALGLDEGPERHLDVGGRDDAATRVRDAGHVVRPGRGRDVDVDGVEQRRNLGERSSRVSERVFSVATAAAPRFHRLAWFRRRGCAMPIARLALAATMLYGSERKRVSGMKPPHVPTQVAPRTDGRADVGDVLQEALGVAANARVSRQKPGSRGRSRLSGFNRHRNGTYSMQYVGASTTLMEVVMMVDTSAERVVASVHLLLARSQSRRGGAPNDRSLGAVAGMTPVQLPTVGKAAPKAGTHSAGGGAGGLGRGGGGGDDGEGGLGEDGLGGGGEATTGAGGEGDGLGGGGDDTIGAGGDGEGLGGGGEAITGAGGEGDGLGGGGEAMTGAGGDGDGLGGGGEATTGAGGEGDGLGGGGDATVGGGGDATVGGGGDATVGGGGDAMTGAGGDGEGLGGGGGGLHDAGGSAAAEAPTSMEIEATTPPVDAKGVAMAVPPATPSGVEGGKTTVAQSLVPPAPPVKGTSWKGRPQASVGVRGWPVASKARRRDTEEFTSHFANPEDDGTEPFSDGHAPASR